MHFEQLGKHFAQFFVHAFACAHVSAHLLHKNLCIKVVHMTKEKDWFTAAAGRRITVVEVGKLLGVNRNTATTRLQDGLSSDEIITLARALHINPVTALEELGKLTVEEVMSYLEVDGQLVETADAGYLALELARRLNPATKAPEITSLEQHRQKKSTPVVPDDSYDDGTVRPWDDTQPHAADNSPDEDALRWKEENPGDTHD